MYFLLDYHRVVVLIVGPLLGHSYNIHNSLAPPVGLEGLSGHAFLANLERLFHLGVLLCQHLLDQVDLAFLSVQVGQVFLSLSVHGHLSNLVHPSDRLYLVGRAFPVIP